MSAGNSTDPQSSVGGVPAIIRLQDTNGNVISDAHPLPVSATVTPSGTQDVNLTKVGGTTFALGQQLATASLPIVLTVAQVASLTGFLTDTQLRAAPVPVSLPATKRTPTCTAAVAGGSTTDAVKNVTFLASSDFVGTVLGATFAAGASITFAAPAGDTLGAMAYTRSAGTLYIYYTP